MMKWLINLARRIRGLPEYTPDDVLNASIDDHYYEFNKVVGRVHSAAARRREDNAKLREQIALARSRTTVFADFEQSIRGERRPDAHH